MKYSLREAISYIAKAAAIDISDGEVSTLILEQGDVIEGAGRAVRDMAKDYEALVILLAAEMVARRNPAPTPEREPDMSVQHRSN